MSEIVKSKSGIATITKRFVVAIISSALIYWSMKIQREWIWCYFESLMMTENPSAELANVATASISALTTAFIASSSTIAFIVAFFITGDTSALQSMFKWQNRAETIGQTVQESINERITQESKVDERIVQEFADKYRDDPSYIKAGQLPDKDIEEFR